MNQPKILVVDDDKEIVGAIKKRLEMEDYEVFAAYDGLEAMDFLMEKEIQLLIIDVMMPKMDGLSATMKIRESKNIPIIILSAKTEESDKILGLSMGADDYISKPFRPDELVARVKSQLRRYLQLGSMIKQEEPYAVENTVMVHIRRIREKIEIDTRNPRYLKVVWGIGYKMEKMA